MTTRELQGQKLSYEWADNQIKRIKEGDHICRCGATLYRIERDEMGDDVYENQCSDCLTKILIARKEMREALEESARNNYFDR